MGRYSRWKEKDRATHRVVSTSFHWVTIHIIISGIRRVSAAEICFVNNPTERLGSPHLKSPMKNHPRPITECEESELGISVGGRVESGLSECSYVRIKTRIQMRNNARSR